MVSLGQIQVIEVVFVFWRQQIKVKSIGISLCASTNISGYTWCKCEHVHYVLALMFMNVADPDVNLYTRTNAQIDEDMKINEEII